MDYYSTLGLKRGASDAEIKKAYRSMAMKHHPDRGGDEAKFKEISTAYDVLSNPEKKRMFDSGMDPNNSSRGGSGGNPFEFHFNTANMDDMFSNFGFGFNPRSQRRNKTLNINIEISLEDVLSGKVINAEVGVPNGRKRVINIEIPPGIENGQQIRYGGMGDDSIPSIRPGDLIVNVFIKPHRLFKREGDSLIYEHSISVWDALLGSSIDIDTLDNRKLSITIPPSTQPETMFSCKGEGMPHIRSRIRGNLLIKIKVNIPKNLSAEQLGKIKDLRDNF